MTRSRPPGEAMVGKDVELLAAHDDASEMEPYERLLGDAMTGDRTLFASEGAVEAQWRILENVLGDKTQVHEYAPGTWGPAEAEHILVGDGGWHDPGPTEESRSANRHR